MFNNARTTAGRCVAGAEGRYEWHAKGAMPNQQSQHWDWCPRQTLGLLADMLMGITLRMCASSSCELSDLTLGSRDPQYGTLHWEENSETNALLLLSKALILRQAFITAWNCYSVILRDGKRAEGTAGRKTEGTTPAGQAKAGEDSAPSNNSGNRPCLYMWGVQHWFNCVKQCDKPSIHGFVGLVFATKLAKTMNKQP